MSSMASRGRRTGVTVLDDIAKSSSNIRMEDAEALFDSALSPPESNETLQATTKPRKPKEQVHFSLADEIVDHEDTYTNLNAQHPTRRLVQLNASRQRASVDTNDLSSVSTAALSISGEAKESPQRTPPPEAQLMDDPDRYPDDELIPPPPDDESSDSSGEEGSEPGQMVATQREEDEHNFPAADDYPGDEEFPAAEDNPEFIAAELQEEYNDDDDNNKDGTGFHISGERMDDNEDEEQEDPETPEAVRKQRRRKAKRADKLAAARKTTEGATVKSKKKKVKDKVTARESSDDSDDDSVATPVAKKPAPQKKKPNPYATTFESKGRPLPQTFTEIPISNLIQSPPEDGNLRRSKRARTKPLEYWRGEKYEWGANDFEQDDDHAFEGVTNMPVPIKVVQANPTPYKKRKVSSSVPKKKKVDKKSDKLLEVAVQEPFDASKLSYPINEGTVAQIWDERYNDTRGIKVASYFATLKPRALPLVKSRKKSDGKVVGLAAQSFSMTNEDPGFPGYIVGSLVLPPKGIKDEESVRMCSQIFTVVRCQPKALEVAYLDEDDNAMERFLLSKGDNVLVPPENKYRLQNHSKTTEALLSWTIIRNNA